jgi:hypothetical protein
MLLDAIDHDRHALLRLVDGNDDFSSRTIGGCQDCNQTEAHQHARAHKATGRNRQWN